MSQQRRGGFLIARVHQSAGRVFARMLRERGLDINPAQGRVLFALWQEGPMPLGELAKRISLSKSALTSAVDRLEAAGEAMRVHSGEDRRRIDVQLTPANRKTQKLYDEISAEMSTRFYHGIHEADIDRFERTLERVLGNLE
jgi:MarR family transcriptional regulator, organic hydroperoxide resistance regulator